jgi:hypothetical protein
MEASTKAFIAGLHRFIARRGRPSDIYSDCGTNVTGADRELRDFIKFVTAETTQESIQIYLCDQGIRWHFNPPAAPHHGSLWEAGVRSIK